MTYGDWQRVLEEGYSVGCRAVQFIGGEPTLHSELLPLVRYASSLGSRVIEVYTNGSLLTDLMIRVFAQSQAQLAFSVYAGHSDLHDAITARKGSFGKTMANIQRATSSGLRVRVGIVAMESNADDVGDARGMLEDMGVDRVRVDRVRGIGRGQDLTGKTDPFHELCGSCWQGKLCVDPNGNVQPCVFAAFHPVGNVREGLTTILNKQDLREFRMRVRQQSQRYYCPPDLRPCAPECAPSCDPCVPDLRS